MNKTLTPVVLVLLILASSVSAKSVADVVDRGNEAYRAQDYKGAMEQYQIAETELPESAELSYNIGGVLYNEGKYEEAVDRYTKSLNTLEASQEALGQYNLGNTYYRMGDYQNAIKAYENSLRINPEDLAAKYNLELARKMLKDQMKPDEQDQQDKQQQEQQQEQQQKEEKDEQQEDQQDQQNQQQNQQQQEQQQEQQQQQQPQEQKMSKEDAERILNALKDDEQDVQKKIKRKAVSTGYSGKDW